MGNRRGWFGDSLLPFVQWLAERLTFKEDVAVCENTPAFDVETLSQMVAGTYDVAVLKLSPTVLGEPVERKRLYIILLRRDTRRWKADLIGHAAAASAAKTARSTTSGGKRCQGLDKQLQRLFEQTFKRNVVMTVGDKFRAPEFSVRNFVERLAESNNLPPTTASGKPWSCFQAMSRAARAKVASHLEKLQEKTEHLHGFSDEAMACEFHKWCSNLQQNADYMGPVSGNVPALLQNSNLWLFGKRRLALPMEHLEVQGWNVWGNNNSYKGDLLVAAGHMRDSRIKSFAGNGMHLHVVAAVLAFVMAVTEKKPAQTAEGDAGDWGLYRSGWPRPILWLRSKSRWGTQGAMRIKKPFWKTSFDFDRFVQVEFTNFYQSVDFPVLMFCAVSISCIPK